MLPGARKKRPGLTFAAVGISFVLLALWKNQHKSNPGPIETPNTVGIGVSVSSSAPAPSVLLVSEIQNGQTRPVGTTPVQPLAAPSPGTAVYPGAPELAAKLVKAQRQWETYVATQARTDPMYRNLAERKGPPPMTPERQAAEKELAKVLCAHPLKFQPDCNASKDPDAPCIRQRNPEYFKAVEAFEKEWHVIPDSPHCN